MARKERIVCDCGGPLRRPIPKICPHCGAEIVGLRRRIWPLILPTLLVVLMFSSLILFAWWLMSR